MKPYKHMEYAELQKLHRQKEERQKKTTPFILSIAVHVLILALFTLVVVMQRVDETEKIVATYIADTKRVSSPIKKREVARQLQRQKASSASAQVAAMVQASVSSTIALPQVEVTPTAVPLGLGKAVTKASDSGRGLKGTGRGGAFGTTTEMRGAFEGTIYFFDHIDRMRDGMRWFHGRGKRRGEGKMYTYSFNIPGRDFREGFPGISSQFEWFAIDYRARVDWPASMEGNYEFEIQVDDGAILIIDGKDVIDHDGPHGWGGPAAYGQRYIKAGQHDFRLAYYQGPRFFAGLVVRYRKSGESEWRIFDLREILRKNIKKVDNPLG